MMSYIWTSENMYECGMNGPRNFLTKEEKVEILKEYKKNLENEVKGVAERIKEMEKNA